MRAGIVLLLIAAGAVAVQAGASRYLLQSSASCPIDQCNNNACMYNSRRQAWTCSSCQSPMVPNQAKTACVCPAGQYPVIGTGKCALCPKGSYCPKGNVAGVSTAKPCPKNMDTLAAGAKALNDCVNKAGYLYKKTATGVAAVPCGPDSYTSGLAKQTQCTACQPGFNTNPATVPGSQTSSEVCVAKPGYFVAADATAPCPKGEYNDQYDMSTSCTPCSSLFDDAYSVGITTAATGSDSPIDCNVAEPGYVLVNEKKVAVMTKLTKPYKLGGAKPCPQKYFCPGGNGEDDVANDMTAGNPALTAANLGMLADAGRVLLGSVGVPMACPGGLWTEDEGAKTVDECVARPGWYMSTQAGASTAPVSSECPTGTYKEEWDRAAGCKTCEDPTVSATDAASLAANTRSGDQWQSAKTIFINDLDPSTGLVNKQLAVRGSSDSCFIQKAMGTLTVRAAAGTVSLVAQICPKDSYGIVADRKYGRSATPCTPCPTNMVTISQLSNTAVQISSYISAVDTPTSTPAGAVPAAPVDQGYFDFAACQTLAGYGYYGGSAQACPKGTYNAGENTLPCTMCPLGTTTDATTDGTNTDVSKCNLYMAGYGDLNGVPAQCPLGTYHQQDAALGAPCGTCTANKWSGALGAVADAKSDNGPGCTLCALGYGDDGWAAKDGITTPTCDACKDGQYGDLTRVDPRCQVCPIDRVFTYAYGGNPDVVNPRATSPNPAGGVSQCVTDFQQIVDGAFYLTFSANGLVASPNGAENIQSCVEECRSRDSCAAITYNYDANNNPNPCKLWEPAGLGTALATADSTGQGIAWKTMPSTTQAASVEAKAMGSGLYSFYYDVDATSTTVGVGGLTTAVTGASLSTCLDSCTNNNKCAGVSYAGSAAGVTLATNVSCQLILGQVQPGSSLRTLTKTRYASLQLTYNY